MEDMRWLSWAMKMGWLVVFTILIPLGVGLWLDKKLGTAPLFILVGMLAGIVTSTVIVYRMTMTGFAEIDEKPEGDRPDSPEQNNEN